MDINTQDLLATAEDAITAPPHLTRAQSDQWFNYTLRHRLPRVREALRIAREPGNTALAVEMIEQAIHDYPAPTSPGRMVRPLNNTSTFRTLPLLEQELTHLFHTDWITTVEGTTPNEVYVGRRPLGWTGQGDPFERVTAPTRTELFRKLSRRFRNDRKNDPEPPDAA
ncbi:MULTISPECIES: hypothetical protein [unclassified Nocardiopsis]|uniref:hypothetical protein n=1 Tax=unclassified Nocardiopsis TaxID=2649073 RepID=UPI0033D68578